MIVATLIAAAGAAVQTGAIPHELSTVLRSRQYDNARVEWACGGGALPQLEVRRG